MTKRKNSDFWKEGWLEQEYETKSVQQIHEETGYAVRTIQRQLRRIGTPIRLDDHVSVSSGYDRYRGTTDPRVYDKMWLRARYAVRTQKQIADELDCSVTTVQRWMRRFGIIPQPSNTAPEQEDRDAGNKPPRYISWKVTPEMAKKLNLDSTEGKYRM